MMSASLIEKLKQVEVSAVLAALGGGAIAAGGFAIIIAGGAILGAGVGAVFAQSPDSALTQAAKLEVVMKEIVLIQKDIRLAQEIIKQQKQAIRSLELPTFISGR